jgi:hypothetical protein
MIEIITKDPIEDISYIDLDRTFTKVGEKFEIEHKWIKLKIKTDRRNIQDIKINNESILHILNSGQQIDDFYEIWLHGDLSVLMERVFMCIAQDDLLRWTKLNRKYLKTESYNDIAPYWAKRSVRNFFARGAGPYWWSYEKKKSIPFKTLDSVEFDKNKLLESLDEDLTFNDIKFYGNAKCKSLKPKPTLPLVDVDTLKNKTLADFMRQVGFKKVLQIQYVEMDPRSFLNVHKDDFTYEDGLPYMEGASQLYCVLKGDTDKIKFKFARAGLIDISKPVLINNCEFVHSLVYDGASARGVLLAYGDS